MHTKEQQFLITPASEHEFTIRFALF